MTSNTRSAAAAKNDHVQLTKVANTVELHESRKVTAGITRIAPVMLCGFGCHVEDPAEPNVRDVQVSTASDRCLACSDRGLRQRQISDPVFERVQLAVVQVEPIGLGHDVFHVIHRRQPLRTCRVQGLS